MCGPRVLFLAVFPPLLLHGCSDHEYDMNCKNAVNSICHGWEHPRVNPDDLKLTSYNRKLPPPVNSRQLCAGDDMLTVCKKECGNFDNQAKSESDPDEYGQLLAGCLGMRVAANSMFEFGDKHCNAYMCLMCRNWSEEDGQSLYQVCTNDVLYTNVIALCQGRCSGTSLAYRECLLKTEDEAVSLGPETYDPRKDLFPAPGTGPDACTPRQTAANPQEQNTEPSAAEEKKPIAANSIDPRAQGPDNKVMS